MDGFRLLAAIQAYAQAKNDRAYDESVDATAILDSLRQIIMECATQPGPRFKLTELWENPDTWPISIVRETECVLNLISNYTIHFERYGLTKFPVRRQDLVEFSLWLASATRRPIEFIGPAPKPARYDQWAAIAEQMDEHIQQAIAGGYIVEDLQELE